MEDMIILETADVMEIVGMTGCVVKEVEVREGGWPSLVGVAS